MLYVRKMVEKFLRALLLMVITSCYFNENAGRDPAAEKEWYCNTNNTGPRSSLEIEEKRNGRKKILLTKTCKCYKKSKFL